MKSPEDGSRGESPSTYSPHAPPAFSSRTPSALPSDSMNLLKSMLRIIPNLTPRVTCAAIRRDALHADSLDDRHLDFRRLDFREVDNQGAVFAELLYPGILRPAEVGFALPAFAVDVFAHALQVAGEPRSRIFVDRVFLKADLPRGERRVVVDHLDRHVVFGVAPTVFPLCVLFDLDEIVVPVAVALCRRRPA